MFSNLVSLKAIQNGVSPHWSSCSTSQNLRPQCSHAIYNAIITRTSSARNLGVIFDSILPMSDHIFSVSKSCVLSIRDLRWIRNTLDYTTAYAHYRHTSKLDYCNSLFLNLHPSQLNHLQLILNSSARAVSKSPKICHITPLLKSIH